MSIVMREKVKSDHLSTPGGNFEEMTMRHTKRFSKHHSVRRKITEFKKKATLNGHKELLRKLQNPLG